MAVLGQGLIQGLLGVWSVARIVIPLMIILEAAGASGILERINRAASGLFRWVGLSEEGAFPVVVAVFFGLAFGSGVIISYIDEGRVSPREVRLIGVFIALCHALVEDTALFAAVGVPVILLLAPRVAAGFLCCWALYCLMLWRNKRAVQPRVVNG